MNAPAAVPAIADEAAWAEAFIRRVIEECPRRQPTSHDERRAHEIIRAEFDRLGLDAELQPFRFGDNLYRNLAVHFGLGVLASTVAKRHPWVAAALHGLAGVSYLADSTRKGFILRRLQGWGASQNMVAVSPASGEPRLRVVFVAHADAAFTGMLFEEWFVRRFGSKPGPLYRPMKLATGSLFASAALDAARGLGLVRGRAADVAQTALALPALLTFLLNADIVARDTIVPGANDNLSGVAGILLLAHRLLGDQPDDVEYVFVASGCEEASLGGADALAHRAERAWDRERTVVLAIDGLSNGDLFWFTEGEVRPVPLAPRLERDLRAVVASDEAFAEVEPFAIPVGGTDAVPFALRGFEAVGIGCVDRDLKAPRNYHLPSDTVDNMDPTLIPPCVDFVEALVRHLVATR